MTRPTFLKSPLSLFSCPQQSHEKAWLHTYCVSLSSLVPRHTGLSRFKPVVAGNPNVKATVFEADIQIYYWFGYEVGVHWNHQAGFRSKRINIVSQCSSRT